MLYQTFSSADLSPRLAGAEGKCSLRAYCRGDMGTLGDQKGRWGVIVCPGGGYRMVGTNEGEPVALAFLGRGVQAFTLRYSVAPARHPRPMLELAAAVAFLRDNAQRFNIDRVALCGFSAGGHLCGTLANLWQDPVLTQTLGGKAERFRPAEVILGYPVISDDPVMGCPGCIDTISPGNTRALSLEACVTPANPRTFLWGTVDDPMVPIENTCLYAGALRRSGVPFELHLFPSGPHASAIATQDSVFDRAGADPHNARWLDLCVEWLMGGE